MGKARVHGISLDSADRGVDFREAASRVSEDVVVMGNISAATTMRFGTPEDVRRKTQALLQPMRAVPHFVLSTGCDLPLLHSVNLQ
jgi:uroporphyrinogen decarboxylase